MKVKLREKLDGWQTVGVYTPTPPAHQPSRPESQRRTAGRAAPPTDPGLKGFLEELGRMAADAVLARLSNHRHSKDGGEPSIKTPRGRNRSDPAKKAGVNVLADRRHSTRVRSVSQAIRDAAGKDS